MTKNIITAGFVIIGNEILSGRTPDQNLNFLAKNLVELGIVLKEVRVIGDFEDEIIKTIKEIKDKYTYIFTSGGIGPTHDDITTACIAKLFNQLLVLNPIAHEILIKHYGADNINDARKKMAILPSQAILLDNPVSSAPGFRLENVFVMAGVPKIFQAMVRASISQLKIGDKIFSKEIKIKLTESIIANDLTNLQDQYPDIAMGSYPFDGGTSLVFRTTNFNQLNIAINKMIDLIKILNPNEKIEIS
jgi:molybdenum cofactor synthesis domain-containing protein